MGTVSRRTVVWVLAMCAAAVVWAAPAGTPAKPKPQLRDNELREAILVRFNRSKSAADHFQVHVQGGTATLTGKTDIVQRKASATRMAKAAGAREVVNNIQVSAAGKAKASQGLRRAGIHRSETQPRSERSERR